MLTFKEAKTQCEVQSRDGTEVCRPTWFETYVVPQALSDGRRPRSSACPLTNGERIADKYSLVGVEPW